VKHTFHRLVLFVSVGIIRVGIIRNKIDKYTGKASFVKKRQTNSRHSGIWRSISGGGNGGGADSAERGGRVGDAGEFYPTEGDPRGLTNLGWPRRHQDENGRCTTTTVMVTVWYEVFSDHI